jgi:integrase
MPWGDVEMGRRPKGPRVLGPYRRKDGLYGIVLRGPSVPDEWFYYKTARKAERAKSEMEGALIAAEAVTIGEAVPMYQEHLSTSGRRQSTVDEAGYRLRPLVRLVGATTPVGEMTRAHLEERLGQLHAVASRKGTLGRIAHFCAFLVERGLIINDPSKGLKVDGIVRRGKPNLTRVEARQFAGYLWQLVWDGEPGSSEKALAILLLLYSGLREGELLRLQVRDLDLATVPAVVQVERIAKRSSSLRDFEITAELTTALITRVEGMPLEAWVWPSASSQSGHREKRWIQNAVKNACERAGVGTVCPQGLRATHARLAREAGVTAHVIATQLGHASTAVTIGSYVGEEADDRAKGRKAFQVISGGRKGS